MVASAVGRRAHEYALGSPRARICARALINPRLGQRLGTDDGWDVVDTRSSLRASVDIRYLIGDNAEREGFEPSWRVSHQPHFQTVRTGCRVGHRRVLRIQIRNDSGTTRRARAPALGLRWDSFRVRLECPAGTRRSPSRQR